MDGSVSQVGSDTVQNVGSAKPVQESGEGREQLAQTGAASSGTALAGAGFLAAAGTGAVLYARRRSNG